MWNNKILLYGIDILLSIYAVYLFFYYFDIFFTRKKKKYLYILGVIVFFLWQFGIMTILKLPVYMNIAVTIVITLITVMIIYEGM